MKSFNGWKSPAVPVIAVLAAVLIVAAPRGGKIVFAQSSQTPKAANDSPPIDEYDRTAQVWYYQRIAKTGADRGEEIYYMKCWICHNDYTRKATPASAGPSLRNLYKRGTLMSGEEV